MGFPQASIPERKTPASFIRDSVLAGRYQTNGGLWTQNGEIFPDEDNVAFRQIQNCGTVPVKVMVNDAASAALFCGVLAACAAQDDGTGGVMDCSKFRGSISIIGIGAVARVAWIKSVGQGLA